MKGSRLAEKGSWRVLTSKSSYTYLLLTFSIQQEKFCNSAKNAEVQGSNNCQVKVLNTSIAIGKILIIPMPKERGQKVSVVWKEQLACFLGCDRFCCYFRNHSGSDVQTGCWWSIQLNSSPTQTSTTGAQRQCPQRIEAMRELDILHLYLIHFNSHVYLYELE